MAIMTFTAMFTVKPLQKDEHCWPMLHVASVCTPSLHVMLLGDVVLSLQPVRLLATCKQMQQLPTMLGVVGQQCCICLHEALSLTTRLKWTNVEIWMTSGIPFLKKLWKSKLRTNNFIIHRKINYIYSFELATFTMSDILSKYLVKFSTEIKI